MLVAGAKNVIDPKVKAFWNDNYTQRSSWLNDTFLSAAVAHFGDVAGKNILDLGCGSGETSVWLAARGANVIAIDISEVAIDRLSRLCLESGIQNVRPVVCSAFEIDTVGPIDFVFGIDILHHLEPFDQFVCILDRCLNPGGKAYFRENNGSLKVLMWARDHLVGRFGIPKAGDDVEHPLTPQEVLILRSRFEVVVDYPLMQFFNLVATYVFRRHFYPLCDSLDRLAYRVPFLRPLSYCQSLALVKNAS